MKKNRKSKKKLKVIDKLGVQLMAIAYPEDDSLGSIHVINIKDIDGRIKELLVPSVDILNSSSIKKHFVENQFPIPSDKQRWELIMKEINKATNKRAIIVPTPGFIDHNYLISNNVCIGAENGIGPFYDLNNPISVPSDDVQGSLEEWRENIAVYALNSSRLMLAICSAFSSYLLRWSGNESGGFHFCGDSSTGKSTCLYTAVSVIGPRECNGTWSATESGLEQKAAGHNDRLLSLDELMGLDDDFTQAAKKARKIVYKLTSGQCRVVSKNYTSIKQQKSLKWRVCILSTGEFSLAEHALEGGTIRHRGEQARLIDVSADVDMGKGIFESLPDNFDTANDLIKHLDNYTRDVYGVAQLVFLRKLVRDLKKDKELVVKRIRKCMDNFMVVNNVDSSNGFQIRFAERFALAYAAGIFAMKYGLLPFDSTQIMNGISSCYINALSIRPVSIEDLTAEAKQAILDVLRNGNLLGLGKKGHVLSIEQTKSADGFKLKMKGQSVRCLTRKKLEELIKDKIVMDRVINEFKMEGRLLCDSKGRSTRSIATRLPGCNISRVFCFKPKSKMKTAA